jgi:hypothetical protein
MGLSANQNAGISSDRRNRKCSAYHLGIKNGLSAEQTGHLAVRNVGPLLQQGKMKL